MVRPSASLTLLTMLTRLYATTRILPYSSRGVRTLSNYSGRFGRCVHYQSLPEWCAHRANELGALGKVPVRLTNPYQLPHARAIGFWFGQGGLYQLLPYITMPPF